MLTSVDAASANSALVRLAAMTHQAMKFGLRERASERCETSSERAIESNGSTRAAGAGLIAVYSP